MAIQNQAFHYEQHEKICTPSTLDMGSYEKCHALTWWYWRVDEDKILLKCLLYLQKSKQKYEYKVHTAFSF